MQFYDYRTTRDLIGKLVPGGDDRDSFYKEKVSFALDEMHDKRTALQMLSEGVWERERRPYYNVYPAIAPMLVKLNLNIDTKFVQPPLPAFCIRLPVDRPPLCYTWENHPWHIRSILVGPGQMQTQGQVFSGILIWLNTGEVRQIMGRDYPVHTYINLPLEDGMSLEESLRALPYDRSAFQGMQIPEEIRTACAKLVCTICLLENDPSLIEPDVLAKDRGKPLTETIVERAHRRGKLGWNIGSGVEVIPHVRRPHPALMWTGQGRTTPKIVMRKGSVVHRDKVANVPTGFQGVQGSQEPQE